MLDEYIEAYRTFTQEQKEDNVIVERNLLIGIPKGDEVISNYKAWVKEEKKLEKKLNEFKK